MANKKHIQYKASSALPFYNCCRSPCKDRLDIVHCRPIAHLIRHSHLSSHLIRRHSTGIFYVTVYITAFMRRQVARRPPLFHFVLSRCPRIVNIVGGN
jgi:hypothetical protein